MRLQEYGQMFVKRMPANGLGHMTVDAVDDKVSMPAIVGQRHKIVANLDLGTITGLSALDG